MEPLVRWLLGGFVVSLLFIAVARWFWKRYDQPSEAALEWQKEQEEKRQERKVWESVEMQMRREAEEAEQKAAFQLKREAAASSGTAPDTKTVSKAFESLGVPMQQSASTERTLKPSPKLRILSTFLNLYKSDKTLGAGTMNSQTNNRKSRTGNLLNG